MDIAFKPIGSIHSPYLPGLPIPQQPMRNSKGEFWIKLNSEYIDGLKKINDFKYIYVIYYLDQINTPFCTTVAESWAPDINIGVFASRCENRPNPIGFSIVEVKGIEGNELIISNIDVFNNTPLLDIKPYIKTFDLKEDSNDGWMETIPDKEHLLAHQLGLPHDHYNHNSIQIHEHSHGHHGHHGHSPGHTHEHSHSRKIKLHKHSSTNK